VALRDLFRRRRRREAEEHVALSEDDVQRLQRVQRARASTVRVVRRRSSRSR
jgi:hypothetical protein